MITLICYCIISLIGTMNHDSSIATTPSSKDTKTVVLNFGSKTLKVDLTEAKQGFRLSKLFKEVNYIPLEFSEDGIIGRINEIIEHNGKFYILDIFNARQLFSFNKKGEFLQIIGTNGNGPGEYSVPFDVGLDYQNNEIEILDGERLRINAYSTDDGSFVTSFKIPVPAGAFSKISDHYALFSLSGTHHLTVIDNSQKVINKYIPQTPSRDLLLENHFVPLSTDRVLFRMAGNNTIYSFENKRISPYLHLDLGKYTFTDEYLEDQPKAVKSNPYPHVKDKVTSLLNYCENSKYIFFNFLLRGQFYYILHSKNSQKNIVFNKVINDVTFGDPSSKIHIEYSSGYNNESFIGYILPGKTDPSIVEKYGGTNSALFENFEEVNSNPILVKVKLKDNLWLD